MALTPKQEEFVSEYLVDLNASAAAVRAGYSAKTARSIASELMARPDVADAIATAQKTRAARMQIKSDRVLEEAARLAFADIADALDWGDALAIQPADGGDPVLVQGIALIPAKDIPKHVRAAIAEVSQTKDGLKVKMHSKTAGLDMLFKHLGLYAPERKEITGKNGGPIETKDLTPTDRARKVAALVAEMQAQASPPEKS